MNEKEMENYGYQFTKGVARYLFNLLIALFIVLFVFNLFHKVDDSDVSRWNRSGLRIHTDNKTGIQYLSDGKGGLIPRLTDVRGETRIIGK